MEKSFPYGICRICGADPPINSCSALLLPSFKDLLHNHLNIKIVEADRCSKVVCKRCVKTVKDFGILAEKAKSLQHTIEKYILFQDEEKEARAGQIKVEEESLMVLSSDEEEPSFTDESNTQGNTDVNPTVCAPESDCGANFASSSPSMNHENTSRFICSPAESSLPRRAESETPVPKLVGFNAPASAWETYNNRLLKSLPSMSTPTSRKRKRCDQNSFLLLQDADDRDSQHEGVASLEPTSSSIASSIYQPDTLPGDSRRIVLSNMENCNKTPVSCLAQTPYEMLFPSIRTRSSIVSNVRGPNSAPSILNVHSSGSSESKISNPIATNQPAVTKLQETKKLLPQPDTISTSVNVVTPAAMKTIICKDVPTMQTRNKGRVPEAGIPRKQTKFNHKCGGMCK